MNKAFIISIAIVLLIIGVLVPPSFAEKSWEFKTAGEVRDWRGEGIEGFRVEGGVFQVRGKEELQLLSPPGLNIPVSEEPHLRIRFRSQSPRYLRVFWRPRAGRPVLIPEITQPVFDRNFHTYWISLTEKKEYRDTIEQLGLIFGGRPGWVEIDTIEIRPFSLGKYLSDQWEEFWLPRSLNLGTINSLSSPRLFGRPFVSWLNKLAFLIIIIGVFFYLKVGQKRKRGVVLKTALAVLLLWIAYDIRETFSQFQIADEIYRSYVEPDPSEKTFPALGAFYRFVDLAGDVIPEGAQYHFYSSPDWPYDCRIKYYLYPRRINSDTSVNMIPGGAIPYHLVYQNPLVRFDPESRRLRYAGPGGEFYVSSPGKIAARFAPDSFIFLED